MRLLFDENLSPKLVSRLSDLFPGSAHVRDVGLASVADSSILEYAVAHGFVVVSKDEDFHHLSFLRGAPPKVIGIHTGNTSTRAIGDLLRSRFADISAFERDLTGAFLALP